jgi:hypothetical protein
VEAHLTLCGWVPSRWGQGGASKNDVVVYTTKTKIWEPGAGEPSPRFNVHTIWNQEPDVIAKNALGMWMWSDDLFWMLAKECLELQACDHSDTHSLGRCDRCHQLF